MGKLFLGGKTLQEIRDNLPIEYRVICNGDLIIPPETQSDKSVHDDIHCGVAATQKRIKLEAWWPEYSRDVEKCKELKSFTQTTLHSWPR